MKLFANQVVIDDGVLFCAFRYALGRMTYVTSQVAEAIKQNAGSIQPKLRRKMIEEITEAIDKGHAGMECDVDCWVACRKALQQSLALETEDMSLCKSCFSMTYTINGACGMCGADKAESEK